MEDKNRFWELEGLRGVASVIVVISHFLLAFYSLAFLGYNSGFSVGQNMRFEDNIYGNPLSVFLSGSFAVAIFFVLSGFVLSIGFFQTGKLDIVKKLAAKRYLRLMIPALTSILIAYVLMIFGLSWAHQVAEITQSGWLMSAWNFSPDFFKALKDGLYGIFIDNGNEYNGALWTMTTEFFGSFMVFGFLALFSQFKYRWVLYAVLFLATFNTWYMAFVIGMVLAELYSRGILVQKSRNWLLILLLLTIGLFLGGYPRFGTQGTLYEVLVPNVEGINWFIVNLTIGATIIIAVVLGAKQIAKLFTNKHIRRLGKYTFSMYLIHLSILYTFTSAMFLLFNQYFQLGFNVSVILSMLISIVPLWGATILFEKYIDSKAITFSNYIANILLGKTNMPKMKQYTKRRLLYIVKRLFVGPEATSKQSYSLKSFVDEADV